jgi:hypothetical protein
MAGEDPEPATEPQPAPEALTERAEPVDDSGARETPGGSPPGPPADDPAAALTTSPANDERPDSPKDAADVLKKVGQIATFIGSWHAAVTAVRDAAAGTGANASALAAAIEDANGLAGQWCPEAAVRWIMTDSDKVITLVGPQSWLMANALSAADRAWPHPRGDWHTGITEWPAAPVEVVNTADRVCAALDEAAQHAAALLLMDRALQSRIGQRIDVEAAVNEWALPACSAAQIITWIGPDPRLDGKKVPLVTDETSGSLYRTPKTTWERVYTTTAGLWGSVIGLVVIGLAFALLNAAHLTTWPSHWVSRLVVLYLCVVAGAALHVASAALSQIQYGDPLKIYAAASGVDWLGLRWLSILRLLIPVVIVAGSLWGAGNIPNNFQDLGVALLAGYSADSLFRNSLARLDSSANAH